MKTNEWAGVGNHNTAKFWEYDTRTDRRGNLDPKPFVNLSPYAAFNNNPILFSDPLGDIIQFSKDFHYGGANGVEQIKVISAEQLDVQKMSWGIMAGKLDYIGEGKNLSDLIHASETYTVEFASGTIRSRYRPNKGDVPGGTIIWNPEGGLETDNGVVVSPTTVGAHELDHASGDKSSRKGQANRRLQKCDPNPDNTDNEEEARVRPTEQRVAEKLKEVKPGQIVRSNHDGNIVQTEGPLSNKKIAIPPSGERQRKEDDPENERERPN